MAEPIVYVDRSDVAHGQLEPLIRAMTDLTRFVAANEPEIIAYTVPANLASQRVMARLGMRRDPGRDFELPALPEGHAFRPHLVFALGRGEWDG